MVTSLLIITFATGMFAYWLSRLWLLAVADEETVHDTLENDWWIYRQIRLLLRSLLLPPTENRL